jgi:hypothetical protein
MVLVLLGGCSDSSPPPAPTAPPPTTGRDETAAIRNTEAIGVSGEAIGEKVDAALDANDARKAELDKALDGQ